ncbi:unnamed protein product [Gongylonema pulchrum]|uniref:Methyltranfer_dom domain-containing protein n=1 Tax=Gongylonema pulchrum TaxID=637853 RepID=A0A183D2X7_9BILA|nr:unnamed protein product [Gongylonema pulchrum]
MLGDGGEDEELTTSRLGTKEYWTEHYKLELKNFEEFGDGGEIWFGRAVENRIVKYITEKLQLSKLSRIIDFGCGNGSLLRALRRKGYVSLFGVDFFEEAVLLARKLTEDSNCCNIKFMRGDLLDEALDLSSFDIIIDKGTWDALSLSLDRDARLKKYRRNVCETLDHCGLFLVCSCNYTG